MYCVVFIATIASMQFISANVVEMEQNHALQEVMRELLNKPMPQTNEAGLLGFSWNDCSGKYVNFKSLSLQPDPIAFPGKITVSADVNVTTSIKSPLQVSIEVSKEEFGIYIPIPCIDNIGSCTYSDVCSKLSPLKAKCPAELKNVGINCECPINKKMYAVNEYSFYVPKVAIPSGKYHVVAKLMQGDISAACIDVKFEIN